MARIAATLAVVAASALVGPAAVAATAATGGTANPTTAVASTTAATQSTAGTARQTAARAPRGPARLVVESITPSAPRPDDTLRITGHLTAAGHALDDVSVRLRFSPSAFTSRSVMNFYAKGGSSARFDTDPVYDTQTAVAATLPKGRSASFTLRLPIANLGIDDFGVYPLAVEVLSNGSRVALRRTFLPFVPENTQVAPTRVAWLWPIVDRPHRAMGGAFIDNKLARRLSPGGRLSRLVEAAAGAPSPEGYDDFPLLWAIDPALLSAAAAMTDGYEVRDLGSSEATTYEESAVAKEWLARLREVVDEQTVFSIPYGDPDVMALHRAGLDDTLSLAITSGPQITEDILGREVTPDVVWPIGGWLNQDTLDTLALAGTNTVILNEHSLPPEEPVTYTPNAATTTPTVGGKMDVLIADSTLTRILGSATRAPGSAVLTKQRFLAETALITDERPYEKSTLLIAPPRRWNPPPGFAADVLAESAHVPWLRPVGVSYLKSHPSQVDRSGLRYPPKARARELSQRYLAEVREIYGELQLFTSILETRTGVFDYALLRTESSAWRAHPKLARQLRDAVHDQLSTKMDKVRIVAEKSIVLAGNAAKVPITIENGLTDSELTVTVGLEIRAWNRARLDVGKIPDQIRILPDHRTTLEVRLQAATPGVIDVTMQLKTPEGRDYGEPVHLEVRATGYGTAAKAITGGALGVLALALAVRFVRRTLNSGSSRDGDDEGEVGEET